MKITSSTSRTSMRGVTFISLVTRGMRASFAPFDTG
jgi:hypothetical protein